MLFRPQDHPPDVLQLTLKRQTLFFTETRMLNCYSERAPTQISLSCIQFTITPCDDLVWCQCCRAPSGMKFLVYACDKLIKLCEKTCNSEPTNSFTLKSFLIIVDTPTHSPVSICQRCLISLSGEVVNAHFCTLNACFRATVGAHSEAKY